MTLQPTCSECQQPMEIGFIPDALSGAMWQSQWHPGPADPHHATFLGMQVGGKLNVDADLSRALPITAFRCAGCGVLRLYATQRKNETA